MLGIIFSVLLGVFVTAAAIKVTVDVLGAVFSEVLSLAGGRFTVEGLLIGIVIGVAAFRIIRNRRMQAMREAEKE